jgi:superfamily II DNA/RNA helicase
VRIHIRFRQLIEKRELAFQITDQIKSFGSPIGVKVECVVGGRGKKIFFGCIFRKLIDTVEQGGALSKKPHVVVATPGRLLDLLEHNESFVSLFSKIRFLVQCA